MNNPIIFNVAYAGAVTALVNDRGNLSTDPNNYDKQCDIAEAFGTCVYNTIYFPNEDPLAPFKYSSLAMLCKSSIEGRSLSSTNPDDYQAMVNVIKALFDELSVRFLPLPGAQMIP